MTEPAIEIEHLRKRYGRFEALADIALSVPSGSVFGLLGPNGAGKSTLIKSLLTIVRPSKCRGRLLGQRIGHRRTLAKVGYLPEHARFPSYLTGRQIIAYSAGLGGTPAVAARKRMGELLDVVGMSEWADRRSGTYSKGMRQRVGLAQALINDPALVFLDEPTDGVDPGGRVEIRRIIDQMREQGRTVFINSHLLDEVEQVADEVAIMANGRIIERGTTEDLVRTEKSFNVRSVGPIPFALKDRFEADGVKVAGDRLEIAAADASGIRSAIDLLREHDIAIREVGEVKSSLEEVFMRVVAKSERRSP